MRVGLNIGYSGKRVSIPLDLLRRAEDLGYDSGVGR